MNKMMIPIMEMKSSDLNLRQPDRLGMKYSVIYFLGCNQNCIFCYQQNLDLKGLKRRMLGLIDFSKIKNFAIEQIKLGHPIKISGGEPLLYSEAVLRLLKIIKQEKGFVAMDTNGTRPDIAKKAAKYLDIMGLDVKSPPDKIEFYTGRKKDFSYDLPLETLKQSKNFPCKIEFKRVMFKGSKIGELEHFYPFAAHAYWILKQARPFPENRLKRIKDYQKNWIEPIQKNTLLNIMNKFVSKHPDLKERIVSITGSTRELKNYHYPIR